MLQTNCIMFVGKLHHVCVQIAQLLCANCTIFGGKLHHVCGQIAPCLWGNCTMFVHWGVTALSRPPGIQNNFSGDHTAHWNLGGGPFRRRRFGAGQLGAVPFRRRTFGRRFLIFIYFSSYKEKTMKQAISWMPLSASEPVETRVLNSTASEASYKPKQRSYRKKRI